MDRNRVTVRYAKALLELAIDHQVLETIVSDVHLIEEALQHKGFSTYLMLPKVSEGGKYKKVEALFVDHLHPLSLNFLRLIFQNNRELFLKDICRNFIQMAKRNQNIVTASVTLANEVDTDTWNGIRKAFEQKLNASIELKSATDPELIGGFVFTIDGWQYDASVATSLKTIKKQLHS